MTATISKSSTFRKKGDLYTRFYFPFSSLFPPFLGGRGFLLLSLLFFEAGPHCITQASFKLTLYLKLALKQQSL
jgi:hypothetical protein